MAVTHHEGEDVIITFEGEDTGPTAAVKNMEARITNLTISGGGGEVDTIRAFGGNEIRINKPVSNYEVSFDYISRDMSFSEMQLTTSTTVGLPTQGTEIRSGSEASKLRWRIILWFLGTDSAVAKSGTIVVPKNVGEILRYIFKDCYSINNEESFASDEYFKGTITFSLSPTDEDGYPNLFKEYTTAQGTTTLTVLNTTAHKGLMTWNTTTPAWTSGTTATKYRV
jgi:hypothetical protein